MKYIKYNGRTPTTKLLISSNGYKPDFYMQVQNTRKPANCGKTEICLATTPQNVYVTCYLLPQFQNTSKAVNAVLLTQQQK